MSLPDYMESCDWSQPTGKLRLGQIAQASSWAVVPDDDTTMAALTQVRLAPKNASTETLVNTMDWGDPNTADWYDHDPGMDDPLRAAGRMR